MDWIKNIADVIITSDTNAKCNWFSYAYVAVMYTLAIVTFLFILMWYQRSSAMKSYTHIWRIAAAVALGFTLVFYMTCQQSLPRRTVL